MTAWLVIAVVLAATPLPPAAVALLGVGTALAVSTPVLLLPAGAVVGFAELLRRIRAHDVERECMREDTALLADLTALALTGGLGIQPSLEIAADAVGGTIADEIGSLLRKARIVGMAAALTEAGGAGRDLYRVIGRAMATGSALLDQVTRVADDLYAELGALRLEKARRVPVTMLFPLTLLILPGFLLLTIAPAFLDAFTHLEL